MRGETTRAPTHTLIEFLLHLVDSVLSARETEDALSADTVKNNEVHADADELRDLEIYVTISVGLRRKKRTRIFLALALHYLIERGAE